MTANFKAHLGLVCGDGLSFWSEFESESESARELIRTLCFLRAMPTVSSTKHLTLIGLREAQRVGRSETCGFLQRW